jgi:hypothetical protein
MEIRRGSVGYHDLNVEVSSFGGSLPQCSLISSCTFRRELFLNGLDDLNAE